ncbi:MAG: hypothetical protein IPP97_12940 [Candidatus Obscuribacter sp.]|nr:hypothetical protein [Candidatus Obscuribacter sp.]MBP6592146.1 hypothetical protein [Candidatus Obscuribacter sp.]
MSWQRLLPLCDAGSMAGMDSVLLKTVLSANLNPVLNSENTALLVQNRKSMKVLDHMLGMHVVECAIDNENGDLLLRLNRARFAFFCQYEIHPQSACLSDLLGATLERIDRSSKSMSFGFDSGIAVNFTWETCRNVEAFAGSIDTVEGPVLWVSEEA